MPASHEATRFVEFERLPATIYLFRIDADGTASFPYVSPACAELYGFEPADAMADAALMHQALHPDDRASFDEAGQASLRTLQPVRWEGRIISAEGRERTVLITSNPTREADGGTQWTGFVTELPSPSGPRELAIRRADVADVHADALAMLAHDLAGPLTALFAAAEWALEELDATRRIDNASLDRERLGRRLQSILRQAHRISDMRDDLLTVAAADADVLTAQAQVVDVMSYLRAAADLEGTGLHLTTDCAPDIYCHVHPSHLSHMLSNLVSNAVRYARHEVTLSAALAGQRVLITVRDDGPGVPPDVAARLFRRFSHAGADVRPVEAGTGLGLYIVRTLAHANRGTVLFSPNETGTRFTIALPAAPPPE